SLQMVERQELSDESRHKVEGSEHEKKEDELDGRIEKNECGMGEYEKKPFHKLPETPNNEKEREDESIRLRETTSNVPPKRSNQKWDPRYEGTLTSLAYISSVASLWKFPEMLLKHGGVFILQYTIVYLTVGMPLLYAEIAIGQYTSCNHYGVFNHIAPILTGLSSCMTFILILRSCVISVIQATTLSFFLATFHSHQYEEGETTCHGSSHSPHCFNVDKLKECMRNLSSTVAECDKLERVSLLSGALQLRRTPFFDHVLTEFNVLPQENAEYGLPHYLFFVSLLVVWILIGLVCFIGIRALGKLSYLISIPILVFFFFMIFGFSTIPNSSQSLRAFEFDWTKLAKLDCVWTDAVSVVVFSLNLGNGGLIKLASHNEFGRSFTRDVNIISAYGYLFNYFTTITLLPYIYYIAYEIYGYEASLTMQMWVDHGDFGLMNVIAETITSRHTAGWMCAVYFVACFILEFESTIISMHVVYTCVIDRVDDPSITTRLATLILLCGSAFYVSFFLITPGGIYQIHQLDRFFTVATIFTSLVQISAFMHLYGFKRFIINVRTMTGGSGPVNVFWWISWIFFAPIVLLLALIMELIYYSWEDISIGNIILNNKLKDFSWIVLVCCIALFPLVALYRFTRSVIHNESRKNLFKPTPEWGPADPRDKEDAKFNERAMGVR
ncbi:hypothetical protein PFISCL1PPCAC_15660, partial [Pristionchus fissidentatus]